MVEKVNIDTWESGCKVRAFDWIDGEHIYMNVQYFRHGCSMSRGPELEKTVLFELAEKNAELLRTMLNSVVNAVMWGGIGNGDAR